MNIEDEILKRKKIKENELIPFGFVRENERYQYSKNFMNDSFRADIWIDDNGNIQGKLFDLEMGEEYTNFRMEHAVGEFVNNVKEEYVKILQNIADNCYEEEYFIFEQTNRITKMICEKYQVMPEFLWDTAPNYGVFRNAKSKKWFGIVMNIDKSKIIPSQTGEIEVLNLKLDEDVPKYLKIKGIYPSYHMSKKNWVSIILDDTLSDEEILKLVAISYENSNIRRIKNKEKDW